MCLRVCRVPPPTQGSKGKRAGDASRHTVQREVRKISSRVKSSVGAVILFGLIEESCSCRLPALLMVACGRAFNYLFFANLDGVSEGAFDASAAVAAVD